MKKTKLLKCLLPLLGVSALTIVPILSTACANGSINQTQSTNKTLVDETSSSTSAANTQTGTTSTSVIDQWATIKKEENEQILKNIKWFYKSSNTESDADSIKNELTLKKLDEPIKQIYDLHNGNKIITDMQNGSETLGFYPYVKLGKNQYTPINLVTTTTTDGTKIKNDWFSPNTNPMLKNKILTMDYFVTKVDIYQPSSVDQTEAKLTEGSAPQQALDSYSLSINKLTLSDATSEFPNGDPRTMATLEQKKASQKGELTTNTTTTSSLQLFNIKRPSPIAIGDILSEYQRIYVDGQENINEITSQLTKIEKLYHDDGSEHTGPTGIDHKPFAGLLNSFKKFSKIQTNGEKNNVQELLSKLEEKNANVFSIIEEVVKGLFNVEVSPLMEVAAEIVEQLGRINTQYPVDNQEASEDENLNDDNLKTHAQVRQVMEWVGVVLHLAMTYYIEFALDLYDLVSTCLEQVNWPNPVPTPIQANLN